MGKTIAVIDDSRTMRSLIAKNLMMFDDEVEEILEAANGAEGEQIIDQNQEKLDLIITDLHMPVRDGLEMLRSLQSKGNKVPIVVISTAGDKEMMETCKSLGVVGFLGKPFTSEDISIMFEMVLRRREKA